MTIDSPQGSLSRQHVLAHYWRFIVVSGLGWGFALLLLWAGVHALAMPVWAANAVGDAAAITFVYFASPQVAFGTQALRDPRTFSCWLAWQALHIAAISWVLDALTGATSATLLPMLGHSLEVVLKIAITPVTLTLNFVVMRWLIARNQH